MILTKKEEARLFLWLHYNILAKAAINHYYDFLKKRSGGSDDKLLMSVFEKIIEYDKDGNA